MKNRNVLAAGALLVVAASAVGLWTLQDGAAPPPRDDMSIQPASQPAMLTYIDPVTGERTYAPVGGETAALGEAVSTSDSGLVEQDSPVPGGGKFVVLDGRFQNAAVVRIESDGATAECVPAAVAGKDDHAGGER